MRVAAAVPKAKMPKQLIQVGSQPMELPDGVTVADWALERISWQNPRLRAFLGCIHITQSVLESNYSLLHCSPERLLDIWRKVRKVTGLIRSGIAPLLAAPSRIPSLEEARLNAEMALQMLERHVLRHLDRFGDEVPQDHLLDVRKLLCVSVGQINAFLQDTFGEMMAGDPRSRHDADYFLSKRFPQDIEEAEWLHATVSRLQDYLLKLEPARARYLDELSGTLRLEKRIPRGPVWEDTKVLLDVLLHGLAPKLKEVLALRGVRFYEIEILDRYAVELPTKCRVLHELHAAACESADRLGEEVGDSLAEREQSVRDRLCCEAVASLRMAALLTDLDRALQDLVTFVPLWLDSIEKRRALLLKRGPDAEAAPG
jgi:hypothetical protein